MQSLIQGQGIIDIVNTYLQVLLEYGYSGLIAFIMIFVSVLSGLFRARSKLIRSDKYVEFNLANILISMLVCTLLLITTVSSLGNSIMSVIYWLLVGLSVAKVHNSTNRLTINKTTSDSNCDSQLV